ncbi:hypothetical protein UFOVP233_78 [uncultured Caudovirales phage]|uniref:Uncharacterized protein n=1 Tax=uncultured Caudovirales phage TaxID=2100421 RepID=A0A6J7WRB7_9CAUD|nr:hypothetical protein UFOVP233_78 [uncultured Caudovirales phage]
MDIQTIGVIAALVIQAAGTVWWAATLNGKVATLEERFDSIEGEQRAQDKLLSQINTTVARLDERTTAMVSTMDRLEKRLNLSVAP